jgi:hypothetical protein
MKVMDQLLNVNGNGIRNGEELLEHITFAKKHTKAEANKWIREKVYCGYLKVKEIKIPLKNGRFHTWKTAEGESIHIAKSDLKRHPEVVYKLLSKKHPFNPYPNFQKEYSTVWECPVFLTLGKGWINEAINFYKYCQKWLKNNESKYHYAFPRPTEEETKRRLKEFKEYNKGKTRKQIAKDYELSYTGSCHDLLSRRWKKDRERIEEFIAETIEMLEQHLKSPTTSLK